MTAEKVTSGNNTGEDICQYCQYMICLQTYVSISTFGDPSTQSISLHGFIFCKGLKIKNIGIHFKILKIRLIEGQLEINSNEARIINFIFYVLIVLIRITFTNLELFTTYLITFQSWKNRNKKYSPNFLAVSY